MKIFPILMKIYSCLYFFSDYPGQCYDPSTNVAKTVGAMWPMKDGCGRVMCEEMGNSMYLSYST